jgi:hypothetical protein
VSTREFSSVDVSFVARMEDGDLGGDRRCATTAGSVALGADLAAAISIVPRPLLVLAEAVDILTDGCQKKHISRVLTDAEDVFIEAAVNLVQAWGDMDTERLREESEDVGW